MTNTPAYWDGALVTKKKVLYRWIQSVKNNIVISAAPYGSAAILPISWAYIKVERKILSEFVMITLASWVDPIYSHTESR
jgi:glycine cleavage system protein P-like pyridoxal-binding family